MHRIKHRLPVAGLVFALLASIGSGAVLANIPGNTFEGGDGNLVVDTAGNTDWVNVTNLTTKGDLATGTQDNSFGQGTKESNVNVHVGTGSIPNSKADLGRFASAFQFINGNLYLQLAWTRNNLSGTVDFDFEINQKAQPDLTTVGDKTLVRTAGDLLVLYDFQGGAQKPTIAIATWQANGTWSNPVTLNASQAEAEVNRAGAVNATAIGAGSNVPAFAFGEANINLTAAGVVPSGVCEGFSSIYVKSRSSTAFNSEIKDFIAPTPVNISNCGTVTVIKHTVPAGLDQDFAFTSTVTGTGASSPFNLNDGGTDTKTVTNVPIGSYTVTEGADPGGFSFDHASCDVTGSATQSVTGKVATVGIVAGGDTVTCTYVNNQQLGAIQITKTDSKSGSGLAGATFSITGPNSYSNSVQSGADGTVCVDGLTFGAYHVTETAAPTGYDIDDATTHDLTVDNNTDCSADPFAGEATSFSDTPTSDIQVRFRDGGSGTTSAVISCDNPDGTTSTADTANWDDTTTVTGISAPVTVTCTITIDP